MAGIILSLLAAGWLAYRAVHGWRQSATLLAKQRAAETAERLATVLGRDMRGVQTTVLASAQWDQFMLDPPFDVRTLAASAFARYPYPESFFASRGVLTPQTVVFLNRSDRRPPWMPGDTGPTRFPVVVEYEPAAAGLLLPRIEREAGLGRRFCVFDVTLGGVQYQVVARLLYRDPLRERLEGVFGFTVNLAWVRQFYFPEVTRQVSRIGDPSVTLPLAVLDASGATIAGAPASALRAPIASREFPLAFFDQLLLASDAPDLRRETWQAVAGAGNDPTLGDAVEGGNLTLAVTAFAAAALVLGLILTARATEARTRLAELRSDFVSTVTHELKTPIAAIRAAGDTMARGRVTGLDALKDYAQLVVEESKRLTRLVDNLLAYARITDVTEAYTFDALDVGALLDEVVRGFRTALDAGGFDVAVEVAPGVRAIRGDRTACLLLFDNLVDNAIRYSPDDRWLRIRARASGSAVTVDVEDHGVGIPADELAQVTRKFFRGRRAGSGGSGLGLAIATRIAHDHGGSLRIESRTGAGTTGTVTLPAAELDGAGPT
jgi:signal transduction histidine kinase